MRKHTHKRAVITRVRLSGFVKRHRPAVRSGHHIGFAHDVFDVLLAHAERDFAHAVVFGNYDVDQRIRRLLSHSFRDLRDGAPCHPLILLRSDIGNEQIPPAPAVGGLHLIAHTRAQLRVFQVFQQRGNATVKRPFRDIDGKRRCGSAVWILIAKHLKPFPACAFKQLTCQSGL